MLSVVVFLAICGLALAQSDFPPPFYRELRLVSPPMQGTDVVILQNLLPRDKVHLRIKVFTNKRSSQSAPSPTANGIFDAATATAVGAFQRHHGLQVTQTVNPVTATVILDLLSNDNYKDDGATAGSLGYLYKVHFQVHSNRSIESNATLYDANGTALFTFRVRAHGHNAHSSSVWPDFNNSDPGLNMFSPDGNTPTGLSAFDLNSPEDDPKSFGPYPVNRAVQGLRGNALFLIPNIRNGILMHTGEWPGWQPPQPMPNSAGCVHAWPASIEHVWHQLVALGVKVRPNTDGKLPYPYKPQGLLSVEQID